MHRSPLPNYLRTYRRRARLSQEEVAFLIGFKRGARICRYERRRQTPNLRTLLAYEFLLRTPIRELYGGVAEEVERGVRQRVRLLIRRLTKPKPCRGAERKLGFLSTVCGEPPPPHAP